MRQTSRIFLLLIAGLSFVAIPVFAQNETYTVKYGDILDVIAASYNVTVACIAEASDLANPNHLRPGDTLVIPANCPPYDGLIVIPELAAAQDDDDTVDQGGGSRQTSSGGTEYTVVRGDVLDLIAASFDVSVTCLAETSELTNPNRIQPGDIIIVSPDCPPYDGDAFVPNPRDTDEQSASTSGQGGGGSGSDGDYVVRRGDVLDLIAARYDVGVLCTAEASGLENPNILRPGDTIVIDPNCAPYDGIAVVRTDQ